MRKLNLTDVFRFSRLVKAAGLKGVIRDVLKTAAEAKQNRKPLRLLQQWSQYLRRSRL